MAIITSVSLHARIFSIKTSSSFHKRRTPRQFLILGFPPCKPDEQAALPVQFAYIDPTHRKALIERGWNFAQMRSLGKAGQR